MQSRKLHHSQQEIKWRTKGLTQNIMNGYFWQMPSKILPTKRENIIAERRRVARPKTEVWPKYPYYPSSLLRRGKLNKVRALVKAEWWIKVGMGNLADDSASCLFGFLRRLFWDERRGERIKTKLLGSRTWVSLTSIAAISIVNKMKVPYYLCLSIFSLDISPGPFSWLESNSGDMIDYQRETVSNE